VNLKRVTGTIVITLAAAMGICAQPAAAVGKETPAALTATTTAFDAQGNVALEGRLLTTTLSGAMDSPVTNVRIMIKNAGANYYTYVTGWTTFYGSDGIRCGEGLFKLDALAAGESAETDTPGLRLRCAPATWRIVATNLLTRVSDLASEAGTRSSVATADEMPAPANLMIAIDGEEHPIQLNNPLVVKLGNRQRRIVVRAAP
jgi:hypothetical protein